MDTNPCFVGFKLVVTQKSHIIRCHDWNPMSGCKIHCLMQILLLPVTFCSPDFHIEAVAEQVLIAVDEHRSLLASPTEQRTADLTIHPAGKRYQAIHSLLGEPRRIDHRHAAMLPFQITTRHQASQVAITLGMLTQQGDTSGNKGLIMRTEPEIDTNDWLYPAL